MPPVNRHEFSALASSSSRASRKLAPSKSRLIRDTSIRAASLNCTRETAGAPAAAHRDLFRSPNEKLGSSVGDLSHRICQTQLLEIRAPYKSTSNDETEFLRRITGRTIEL